MDNLEVFRVKIPRLLAVFFSFIILATVPVVFILLFVPLILEQVKVLQGLDYSSLVDRVQEPVNSIEVFIIKNFKPANTSEGFLFKQINENIGQLFSDIEISALFSYLLSFASTFIIYLLAVSFITFFLLYEKGIIRRNLLAVIPNAYFEVAVTTVYKIERLLSNYLVGLLAQITILFTIIASGLSILGVKYALTIATFAAFINLIPYLGPVLGYVFGVIVVFSTNDGNIPFNHHILLGAQMLPVFIVAQLIDNLVLQPIIFSKSVKAHPLEIFISIFVGAAVAGGWGMIAAIPVYTIIRVSSLELSAAYRKYKIFKIREEETRRLINT